MLRNLFLAPALCLMACGPMNNGGTELKSLPDNYPMRTSCYGLGQGLKQAIRVRPDDATDIRLCASVQKDGHIGLDVNYHPAVPANTVMAMVTLRGTDGKNSSGLFPLKVNPVTGSHELSLTDGCSVGALGGCSQPANRKNQDLFEALRADNGERFASFTVDLAFVSVKSENELHWDLHDSLSKRSYSFAVHEL
jgi:hypothetical protein